MQAFWKQGQPGLARMRGKGFLNQYDHLDFLTCLSFSGYITTLVTDWQTYVEFRVFQT